LPELNNPEDSAASHAVQPRGKTSAGLHPLHAARPLVTVITPVYNAAETLESTVASVMAQTWRSFELILIDDGSTDDSADVIRRCVARWPDQIRNTAQANAGAAAARNAAARMARGRYLAFIDADDEWEPAKLETQVALMTARPDLVFSHTETLVIDADGRQIDHWRLRDRVNTFTCLHSENFIYILTAMVRRDAFERVGAFDEQLRISADYDLWLRLARIGPFANIAMPLARYRLHDSNLSHDLEVRCADNLTLLGKPEVSDGISSRRRALRRACVHVQFAGLYEDRGQFNLAAKHYTLALLQHPLVGAYYSSIGAPIPLGPLDHGRTGRAIKAWVLPAACLGVAIARRLRRALAAGGRNSPGPTD
jgi:glycosyltransferase involved in cell wall biosynthesis